MSHPYNLIIDNKLEFRGPKYVLDPVRNEIKLV